MLWDLTDTRRVVVLYNAYGGRSPCHKEYELLYGFSIFHKPLPNTSGKLAILDSQKAVTILITRE